MYRLCDNLAVYIFFYITGGLVSHRSSLFQEEFPSLAQEEKHKEPVQTIKKEDVVRDIQYGPGPSLRPQSKSFDVLFS